MRPLRQWPPSHHRQRRPRDRDRPAAAFDRRIVWRHRGPCVPLVRQASADRQPKDRAPPPRCKESRRSRLHSIQNRGRVWPLVCTLCHMRILVSNDDGIYSPGIAALAQVASEFGDVRVVAPDVERSSAGHSITATHPMAYRPTRISDLTAYRVNGTPADCVALGTHHWDSVDLVLSGLNLGFNLGNAMWHSGTLAAAKQAVLLGIRGVALSVPAGVDQDFESVKPWIRRVLDIVIAEPSVSLINVNLPRDPRGLLWTRVSV